MGRLQSVLVIMAGLALAACAEPDPVVLAVANGGPPIEGATLAIEEAEAAGFSIPFDTLLRKEIGTTAAPAVNVAQELVGTPHLIGVLGHSNSAASVTAAPIYNQARVVQLASHSTARIYSEAGEYSFRMVPPDDQQGRLIADHLASELAGRRTALVYVNDEYGRSLRASFLDALPPDAVELVIDAPYVEEAGRGMIRRTLTALDDARPEVLVWLGRADHLALYLPRIRERLGPIPIIGGDGLIPAETFPNQDGMWTDVRFVRLVDLAATPATRAFVDRFRARFGHDPDDAAALSYDAMSLFLAALDDGVRTGPGLRDYLRALGRTRPVYHGVTGPIRFDEDGDVDRDYALARISASTGAPADEGGG